MSKREVLRAAFDAVNARSVDGIMAFWSADGVYDNPMVGTAARGTDAVRGCMVALVDSLGSAGKFLRVDRMTVGDDVAIAEWRIDPPDGRRGVHVAEFDEVGKLARVTVYPRGN